MVVSVIYISAKGTIGDLFGVWGRKDCYFILLFSLTLNYIIKFFLACTYVCPLLINLAWNYQRLL